MSPRAQGGFTLLELLVALAVLGFLALGLLQGTRFGLDAWSLQARLVERSTDLEVADRALRRIITQLRPVDDPAVVTLQGSAAGFECITELPQVAALPTRLAHAAVMVDGAGRLVLRWTPWVHARPLGPPPQPEESELLRGLARIEVAYWSTRAGVWTGAWTGKELPNLIRFRLVFPSGESRHWPDIIAAPMQEAR